MKRNRKFSKLRGSMIENDITQTDIARKLLITQAAVNHRFTGRVDWRLSEMYTILEMVGASEDSLSDYFPNNKQ